MPGLWKPGFHLSKGAERRQTGDMRWLRCVCLNLRRNDTALRRGLRLSTRWFEFRNACPALNKPPELAAGAEKGTAAGAYNAVFVAYGDKPPGTPGGFTIWMTVSPLHHPIRLRFVILVDCS